MPYFEINDLPQIEPAILCFKSGKVML